MLKMQWSHSLGHMAQPFTRCPDCPLLIFFSPLSFLFVFSPFVFSPSLNWKWSEWARTTACVCVCVCVCVCLSVRSYGDRHRREQWVRDNASLFSEDSSLSFTTHMNALAGRDWRSRTNWEMAELFQNYYKTTIISHLITFSQRDIYTFRNVLFSACGCGLQRLGWQKSHHSGSVICVHCPLVSVVWCVLALLTAFGTEINPRPPERVGGNREKGGKARGQELA